MNARLIKNICTCDRETETHPSSHSGTCPVWATHHGLLNTASIVADPNATFDERLAVAEDLFSDLMVKLDEIDEENGS